MSGNSLLLDTNVILYFLNGDDTLLPILEERNLILSVITELELLGYSEFTDDELKNTKEFLSRCSIINLNSDIKDQSIAVRRKYKLKLPDSIIAGTALSLEIPLITADQDFKIIKSANIILYEGDG